MKLTLTAIAKLLDLEIFQKGDIKHIWLSEIYILTENPFTREIELNSLETYESSLLSLNDLSKILEFKFVEIMKKQNSRS